MLFGAGALVLCGVSAQADEDPVCVSFQKSEAGKSLLFEATNGCDKKLACHMSWSVRCEENDGSLTSRETRSARFTLAPSGTDSLTLSAEACKQSWRIDDIAWGCDDAK